MPGTFLNRRMMPGQARGLNAFQFNQMLAASDAHADKGAVSGPAEAPFWQCTVWIDNTNSSYTLQAGDAAVVTSPVYDPQSQWNTLWTDMVLSVDQSGGKPYTVIAAETIAPGSCGRAYASGVCPATVDVKSIDHTRAKAVSGSWNLESAATGEFDIVWKPAGLGLLRCIVARGGGDDQVVAEINAGQFSGNQWPAHPTIPDVALFDFTQWETWGTGVSLSNNHIRISTAGIWQADFTANFFMKEWYEVAGPGRIQMRHVTTQLIKAPFSVAQDLFGSISKGSLIGWQFDESYDFAKIRDHFSSRLSLSAETVFEVSDPVEITIYIQADELNATNPTYGDAFEIDAFCAIHQIN